MYKKVKLNNFNIAMYKNKFKPLSHINIDDSHSGILLLDNNIPVGVVDVDIKTKCITALCVTDKNKRKGIGTYLLKFAINNLKATNLTVRKTNKKAIALYEKK